MSRYTLIVCCLVCDRELDCVTEGTTDGRSTNAIARCPECGREYLIAVQLAALGSGGRAPVECGTEAGYRRHRRQGGHACDACRAAHTRHNKPNAKRRRSAA